MKYFLLALSLTVAPHAIASNKNLNDAVILSKVFENSQPTKHVAKLHLDREKGQMSVTIFNDPCGQFSKENVEFRCLALPVPVATVSAPIEKTTSECGSLIFEGSLDEFPVDGPRTYIRVENHQERKCTDYHPSQTEVWVDIQDRWSNTATRYEIRD